MTAPLPPIPKEAFDGEKAQAAIPKDKPMEKRCTHKQVKLLSSTELKCECGSGWSGPNIVQLYKLLSQT